MKFIIRGLVMVCGFLALLVALAFWFNPVGPATRLGISALDARVDFLELDFVIVAILALRLTAYRRYPA